MHFTGKISKLDFDHNAYLAEIRKNVKIQLRLAVADWLRAVIELVPVSTGMARACLKPIGDYAGVDVDVFTATTIGNTPIRKPTPTRNKELGEEMGKKPYQAFTGNQYQYLFQYDIFRKFSGSLFYQNQKNLLALIVLRFLWRFLLLYTLRRFQVV